MSKYKFFALTGVAYNFWSCTDSIKYLFAGFSFISLADLLLAGAGLVLCIALIRKKSAAPPKARLLLLITAGWSIVDGALMLANPTLREAFSEAEVLSFVSWVYVVYSGFHFIANLIMWKLWSSEEAAKYANA